MQATGEGGATHNNPVLKTYGVMKTTDHDSRFSQERLEEVFNHLDIEELKCYDYLQNNTINTSDDYKEKFMIYYRMLGMRRKHKRKFFLILKNFQKKKRRLCNNNLEINFGDVLKILHNIIKMSPEPNPPLFLCSALIHTVNSELPVWDNGTIDYLGILDDLPSSPGLHNYGLAYNKLIRKSNCEIQKDPNRWFRRWQNLFNEDINFSQFNLTKIKILDLFFGKEKRVSMPTSSKSTTCPFSGDEYIIIRARIDKALQLLCQGLAPYMERELSSSTDIRNRHEAFIRHYRNQNGGDGGIDILATRDMHEWDASLLLNALQHVSYNVFSRLDDRRIIRNLLEYRHHWAHPNPFYKFTTTEKRDMRESFQNMVTLLTAVEATQKAGQINHMMNEIG